MLSWIIQATIISIVLIFLVHHLFNFFKSTLTVPKIKDLVNTSTQKYDNMFSIISKGNYDNNNLVTNTNLSDNYEYTMKDLLPKPENDMKSELKNFLKKQLNPNDSSSASSTSISALDSMMSNSYSEFK